MQNQEKELLTYRHPLSRELTALIWNEARGEGNGTEEIGDHLYDYLSGLVDDLEEEGLPSAICYEATVAALIDVCAVALGRVKASALINRLTAEMLIDPELTN